MQDPLVAVVLLNYNTYADTVECVHSLINIDYNKIKIIIVDNCSNDAKLLREDEFLNEHCDIIFAKENGGFSAGNNIGIKYAWKHNPQFFLLLNNDTIVEPGFLKKMVECMNEYKCGMVTGCSKYYSNRDKIDFRGGSYNRKDGYVRYNNPKKKPEKGLKISFASGCLWLLDAKIVEDIGYLDESYFMYGEDVEYCNRIIDSGYDIVYCDEAVIYHKISASTGINSPFKQYYITRNTLYNIKLYGTNKLYAYLKHIYGDAKEIIVKKASCKATFLAWKDFLRGNKGKSIQY